MNNQGSKHGITCPDYVNYDKPKPTNEITFAGKAEVPTSTFSGNATPNTDTPNIRFGSINSKFITDELLGERKRVFGLAIHVEFIENGERNMD